MVLSVTDALSAQGAGRKEPNKACRLVVYVYVILLAANVLIPPHRVYEYVIPLAASVLIPTHRVYEYVILFAASVLIPTHRVYECVILLAASVLIPTQGVLVCHTFGRKCLNSHTGCTSMP